MLICEQTANALGRRGRAADPVVLLRLKVEQGFARKLREDPSRQGEEHRQVP